MSDPKNITEETTLAELREQLLLLEVIAVRLGPPCTFVHDDADSEDAVAASVHHATGFHMGTGPTEATAIEAALVKLRRVLLPAPLKQYLQEIETK
jgi:hypothetical protein